ncbi:MAG: hypothetical protein IJF83_13910 [Methanobrevibacter sp.]|nr:hypothetical protein [Methanobrevibacter sp.]
MNVKERIVELNYQHTGKKSQINELLITIITKFQMFEPCLFLAEDEEWVNVSIISIEDENVSQAVSIRKSEITMLGIFNREDVEVTLPTSDPEAFYQ